jgi:hypothetical protein
MGKHCLFLKVMKAMRSSKAFTMTQKVEVDETCVGGQDDTAVGRNEVKKRILALAIEKNGKGVSRMYGQVIPNASRKNLKQFMESHISSQAEVITDKWTGYKGLEKDFPKLQQVKSVKKGKNFQEVHRTIMMFKAWLRGVHHSVKYLQAYVDEYTYRFNQHFMTDGIFKT